ncbi:MAG: LLM class flavin-dependent oxidoreductase [Acidimicrobiia bacterium]|nr:LLM class flavin-dependent oxidoreductase [Acidimicrobiia bacterium]
MRPLKVGIQLPEVERVVRWPELAEMAHTAEAIGLDSVWVGDHLLYRDRGPNPIGPWEAWSVLAALAAVTKRVEIGPLVATASFHNPAMIATKASAVDEISGGRLILGLGAGWNDTEYRAFGFPFEQRVSRFEEAFTIIRRLLRDGHVDFTGRFFTVSDLPLVPPPRRPGGPPLLIGSIGPRMLEITLPHVDAWNAWFISFDNSVAGYLPVRDRVDEACGAVGRDPADVERTLALLIAFSDAVGRNAGREDQPIPDPIPGVDPGALADTLRGFADAGVAQVQLLLDPITVGSIAALEPMLAVLDG